MVLLLSYLYTQENRERQLTYLYEYSIGSLRDMVKHYQLGRVDIIGVEVVMTVWIRGRNVQHTLLLGVQLVLWNVGGIWWRVEISVGEVVR